MNDTLSTLWRDLCLGLVGLFMCIVILLIFHIGQIDAAQKEIDAPGRMSVMITWEYDKEVASPDVDLWVQNPLGKRVGYSARDTEGMSLLRDDLGDNNDNTESNTEFVFVMGVEPGEYIINVHLYRQNETPLPVKVNCVVAHGTSGGRFKTIWNGDTTLKFEGDEQTLVRFTMRDPQRVEPGSINFIPVQVR